MKADVVFVIGILVTGCAAPPSQDNLEDIGPYPYAADFKPVVMAHIRKTFVDPYSIRSASVSQAVRGHLEGQQGWLVCVEANAKNRVGGYVGLQRAAVLLKHGQVALSRPDSGVCNGPSWSYLPWPELEQIK